MWLLAFKRDINFLHLKLVLALVFEVLLFACSYWTYNRIHTKTASHADDTPVIIDMSFQSFGIFIACTLIFKNCTINPLMKANRHLLASAALIISLSSLINAILDRTYLHGSSNHHGSNSHHEEDHEQISFFVICIIEICLRIITSGLWWTITKLNNRFCAAFEHIVVAVIFSKMVLLLKVFIIDLDWAFCMADKEEGNHHEITEECEHSMHGLLQMVEITILIFCVFEFGFFVVKGMVHGGWELQIPVLVLLFTVICLNSYCLISQDVSHGIVTVARSLTFIEVAFATIDASDTLKMLAEEAEHESESSDESEDSTV